MSWGRVNFTLQLMRPGRAFACLATLAGLSAAPSNMYASSRWETLDAIHRIENPKNSAQPGRHGELGAYQFRRATWDMHTKLPFELALDRDASERVAIKHYEWLKRGLLRNGIPDTPYNIALAWNGGLTAVIRGSVSRGARDYAERVSNLVQDLRASRLAAAP